MSKQRLFSQKYRFYPTPEQESFLNRTLGCTRVVYNKALFEHKLERENNPNSKWNYNEVSKKLTAWKKDPELFYLLEVSSVALQQSARNLDTAFKRFFKKNSKFPRFKRKGEGGGINLTKAAFSVKNEELYIAKCKEPLKVVYSRPLPEGLEPTSITITKKASGKWFVSLKFEGPKPVELPKNSKVLGIDLGLEHFLTTNEGEKVENPRFYRKYQHKLAKEQRKLSRKQKGSSNYEKQRVKVARVHETIVNSRLDFLHKLSTKLIRENQTIRVEDLCITGMLKTASKGLRKSIYDASWGEFLRQLEYKAFWYGRTLERIDRFFPSSQICNNCGCKHSEKLNLSVRSWQCQNCEAVLDRDINAAKNIAAGRAVINACGSKFLGSAQITDKNLIY
jgi:putative transposase